MSFGAVYNLTLQRESSSINSVLGNFFPGSKNQQLVICKATSIDLCKINSDNGSLEIVFQQELFTLIRSLNAIKISGISKSLLAIVTGSGDLQIWEIPDNTPNAKSFTQICNEPFGKSGFRRVSPGNFLVSDYKGRAIMLGAIEKNKLVYVLHKKNNEISDEEGNDVTNENVNLVNIDSVSIASPLEANRSRILTVDLVAVDVGYDNPLFAAIEIDYSKGDENNKYLTFYELDLGLNHVLRKSSMLIPRTSNMLVPIPGGDLGPSGVLICMRNFVEYRSQNSNAKSHFLPIPQLYGASNNKKDSYIISHVVHVVKNKKDNTFLIILQTNHGDLFKITLNINTDLLSLMQMKISYFDTIPIANKLLITRTGLLFLDLQFGNSQLFQIVGLGDVDDTNKIYSSTNFFNASEDLDGIVFERHENLENLELVDELEGISPLIQSSFTNDGETTINNNLSVISPSIISKQSTLKQLRYGFALEEVISTELPKDAKNIFTTKINQDDEYDKYLVISFSNSTLVLLIGESIEEVSDSGFYLSGSTLCVEQMGYSTLIQAHTNGVFLIKNGDIANKWFPPAGIKIIAASSTKTQLIVALLNKTIVYFELNDLEALEEFYKFELHSTVISMSLGDIAEGKFKSDIAAISCNNQTLHLFTTSNFELILLQELSSNTTSILLNIMNNNLNLHIGLSNGIYVKTNINERTYKISNRIVQYLGPSEVNLRKLTNGEILICGFKNTYIGLVRDYFEILPLTYNHYFKNGASFCSEDTDNGLIGIHDQSLYILTRKANNNTSMFGTKETIDLDCSPKEFQEHNKRIYILENDLVNGHCIIQIIEGVDENTIEEELEKILEKILLENFKGLNICKIFFKSKNKEFMVVSITELTTNENYIYVFDILTDGKLVFLNKTEINLRCFALQEFLGKLLIGMGNTLRVYDLGQKQLLRKSEIALNLSNIVLVKSMGLRIYIADIRNSITFLEYDIVNDMFKDPICTDAIARHVSCFEIIDYDTVIGGDKFGNIWILRYNGKKNFELLSHYFISDIPMNFHKLNNINQSLVYTCLQGKIGVLLPLITKSEIKFFQNLQQEILDTNFVNLMNFSKFRGYYVPSSNILDGDLIELFTNLTQSQKSKISLKLDKSIPEIEKRIVEIRLKVL